jgi:flagellar assembly protein FliH
MALIKGKKDENATAPAQFVPRSLITRGNLPEEREQREAPFEEGLPVDGAPATKKVFGNLHRTTNLLNRTLPPIEGQVRVPTSESEAQGQTPPPAAFDPNQTLPSQQPAPQQQQQQPMYQQGPPVDQAIIEEAQRKAQQILEEAQAAANQMATNYEAHMTTEMQKAQEQIQQMAQQVQQQAHEAGMQQGYQAGLQQGAVAAQEQVTQLILRARDVYVQAIRQRHILIKGAEPQLARLASKIAEKIIGIEVDSNKEAVVGVVRSAIAILGDREEVSIRVNPADLEAVRAQRTVFEKMVEGLRKFEIVPDAAIDAGGCSIETNLGNVDARLNTQIATLQAALENTAKIHDREVLEEAGNMVVDFPEVLEVTGSPEVPEVPEVAGSPEE